MSRRRRKPSNSRLINYFLHPLGTIFPRAAMVMAGLLGQMGVQAGKEPYSAGGLRSLLDWPPERPIRPLIRSLLSHYNRDRLLVALLQTHGYTKFEKMIAWENPELLQGYHENRRPALVVNFHAGAMGAPIAIDSLKIPFLLMRGKDREKPGRKRSDYMTPAVTDRAENRPMALRNAMERLQQGGMVYMALDSPRADSSIRVPFLGRALPMARGSSALAMRSGADVIALSAQWDSWRPRIRVRAFEIIGNRDADDRQSETEEAILRRIAGIYEDWLRRNPEQIRIDRLKQWDRFPMWESASSPEPTSDAGPTDTQPRR